MGSHVPNGIRSVHAHIHPLSVRGPPPFGGLVSRHASPLRISAFGSEHDTFLETANQIGSHTPRMDPPRRRANELNNHRRKTLIKLTLEISAEHYTMPIGNEAHAPTYRTFDQTLHK